MQDNREFSHAIDSGDDGAQQKHTPHGRAASMLFRYILFGVLTTAVNVCVFSLLRAARVPLTVSVAAAWGISVAFAFVTNRSFVFRPDADAPVQHMHVPPAYTYPCCLLIFLLLCYISPVRAGGMLFVFAVQGIVFCKRDKSLLSYH